MARKKTNWRVVGGWPILVHTLFLDHNKFTVEVTKGVKNATKNRWLAGQSPWFTFDSAGVDSHHEAATLGFNIAAIKLKEEKAAKQFIELENSLLIEAKREEYRKTGEAYWKGVTQVTPKPEPIVWAASVFTPDRKWNEVYMSVDRREVCIKGKECAIKHRRCVKIHPV